MICTLGPASANEKMIHALIDVGMNVARLNFSHNDHAGHQKTIELLKKIRAERGCALAIMLDTKGPEVRVGELELDLNIEKGAHYKLVGAGEKGGIPINPSSILNDLKVGDTVLFDDGYIESKVIEVSAQGASIEALNSATLKSRKGVNLPGTELKIPFMTKKDIADIEFGCHMGVDCIAASFVCTAADVLEMRRVCARSGDEEMMIISKIESRRGVKHFDEILKASDGIMVARGDLGVEVPAWHVPRLQKTMIRKCRRQAKPVIIATQMLESMITNPRPTRAEVSDVANAIYDGASCVMLSGESAAGAYPIESAKIMKTIAKETESALDYEGIFYNKLQKGERTIPAAAAVACVKTAYSIGAKAIFAYTASGTTVRYLAKLMPRMPVLALAPNEKMYHRLALNWNTAPFLTKGCSSPSELFEQLARLGQESGYLNLGDCIVLAAGFPFGVARSTNMMMIHHIGDVVLSGASGYGKRVCGPIEHVFIPTDQLDARGKILALGKCDEQYDRLLQVCSGVILENHEDDLASQAYALEAARKWSLPLVVRADGAFKLLKSKQVVTLDPSRSLVFDGDIKESL
jgi:pyruvate kinase